MTSSFSPTFTNISHIQSHWDHWETIVRMLGALDCWDLRFEICCLAVLAMTAVGAHLQAVKNAILIARPVRPREGGEAPN